MPRTNHTAAAVGTKMYIFAGNTFYDNSVVNSKTYGDFQVLDTETMTWSEPTVKGKIPSPRSGHQMLSIGKKIFVFGGGLWNDSARTWSEKYKDMYCFDTG